MTVHPRRRAWTGRVALSRRGRAIVIVAATAAIATGTVATIALSLALFTAPSQTQAVFGAKAIFPGERVTPAFQIGDSSSGAEGDRSSPFAVPADGLTRTTSAWSSAFAVDRYLEFDLNNSLASGVGVSAATFDFRFASNGVGQACYYFEVRRISTGATLGTYGNSGNPVGCVTGTTLTSFSTSVPVLASTSIANDLRIRVFGKETGGAPTVIDRATVGGSTAYQLFTLYPVMFRDAADSTTEIVPWGLAVP